VGIPNLLSLFRLALVPVFVVVYFSGLENATVYAALIYALACFTDVLDGYIARKYQMTSDLGKILDPLGDKMITLAVLICITVDQIIPFWAVIVYAAKELLMALGGLVLHKRAGNIPKSNVLGKVATAIFFVVCSILMLFPEIPGNIASILICVAIGGMLVAFGGYLATFLSMIRRDDPPKQGNGS